MNRGADAGQPPACAPGQPRDDRSSMVLPPAWRTRTTRRRRLIASIATVVPLLAIGLGLMLGVIGVLRGLGLPGWVTALPWVVPTAMATFFVTDVRHGADPCADDVTWVRWAIERLVTGEGDPSPLPLRLLMAVVVGAPLTWVVLVLFVAGMM